jgi:hypothetical protein
LNGESHQVPSASRDIAASITPLRAQYERSVTRFEKLALPHRQQKLTLTRTPAMNDSAIDIGKQRSNCLEDFH